MVPFDLHWADPVHPAKEFWGLYAEVHGVPRLNALISEGSTGRVRDLCPRHWINRRPWLRRGGRRLPLLPSESLLEPLLPRGITLIVSGRGGLHRDVGIVPRILYRGPIRTALARADADLRNEYRALTIFGLLAGLGKMGECGCLMGVVGERAVKIIKIAFFF